jgi:hypothetical protein
MRCLISAPEQATVKEGKNLSELFVFPNQNIYMQNFVSLS